MALIAIFLLLFLFLAGLLNLYFYLPPKKLYAWLQSFFLKMNSSSSSSSSSSLSTAKVTPYKERSTCDNNSSDMAKEDLKSVFATFDKNGDGFITKQELRDSLKNIKIFMTEKEIEEMVAKVDSNGDGFIDYEEFCFLCESIVGGEGVTRSVEDEGDNAVEIILKEAFDVFDRNKDGRISGEELGSVLCSLGLKEGTKVEDCKEMIRQVDMDGDGMVNFDEFKKMMRSGNSKFIPVF
ncbi:hypothetical protein JCGZ_17033 [Jatropha curcas]|uniref:EF-hand domain-containing protein n=1 Tax=Jatropha curcas TaxID=180498 RepID=A0A067K230_JATCU|nr:calmodulin-like protein 3 [Jatropha curcas]KDP30251.1 hypothetical protein JCGZ_17033 [Jatropha curcas]